MRVGIIGKGLAGVLTGLVWKKYFPDAEVDMYYDSSQPTEPVGSGSWPNLLQLLGDVADQHPTLWRTWDSMGWDSTPKTGILYEGWGKNHRWFHEFAINSFAMHFNPKKFQEDICSSGIFNMIEQRVTPSDVDATYVYDCGGSPTNYEDYFILPNPLNSVILAELPPTNSTVTRTVATPDGWCFVIPLRSCTTLGYLYNSTCTKTETAEENFRDLFKVAEFTGHRSFANYCAKTPVDKEGRVFLNGNKYFFIEPMEASSITGYLVWLEYTLQYIWGARSKEYIMENNLRKIKENANFLLYHYLHGSKYKSTFWKYVETLTVDDPELYNKIDEGEYYKWNRSEGYSYYSFISLMSAHHNLVGNDYETLLKTNWR